VIEKTDRKRALEFFLRAQLRSILENSDLEIVPVKVHDVLHLKSVCTYLGNNCVIVSKGHFDTDILRGFTKIVVQRGEEYAAD